MEASSGPASFSDHRPKTLRFCSVCQKETTHEIRSGAGVIAMLCIPCINRSLAYELDRD